VSARVLVSHQFCSFSIVCDSMENDSLLYVVMNHVKVVAFGSQKLPLVTDVLVFKLLSQPLSLHAGCYGLSKWFQGLVMCWSWSAKLLLVLGRIYSSQYQQ